MLKRLILILAYTAGSMLMNAQEAGPADSLRGSLRPERTCYDVEHYDLHVRVDTASRSISGSNRISFRALEDVSRIQLDLFSNMEVVKILFKGNELPFERKYNAFFVQLDHPVSKGQHASLTVYFRGKPLEARNAPWDGGFTWSRDKNGKPWIAVSCQGIGASLWWPCKDYLGDEPDSMDIHCTVPKGLICVSNGKEMPANAEDDGSTTWNWHVSYPINNYNVTLNIADYVHFHDVYFSSDNDSLALDYYVLRGNESLAKKQFMQVKPMLTCYEKFLGKYPFQKDGYALVETPYLGMEHQGAIAYGNKYRTGYLGSDRSGQKLPFDYIIIHETGHEWWGNSVSTKDLADMWIHEAFCTYSEAIYVECMHDYDTAMTYVNALRKTVVNKSPMIGIYGINREGHYDMYVKGMLFLNTLRHAVHNDSLWWDIIRDMADERFKLRNTDYSEVVAYFSERTGMDLSPVFDQYVRKPYIPVLEYKLKKKRDGYVFCYRWKTDNRAFALPLYLNLGGQEVQLDVTTKWQKQKCAELPVLDARTYYIGLLPVNGSLNILLRHQE